jgi:hypothetical protein
VVKFSKPAEQMNFTVTIVEDALWSGLEITLGIINACLPVIPPAVQRIFNIPFLQLISFSTNSSRLAYWMRLGNSKDESKTGIERSVEYSVDIESDSSHRIRMENMGSTTKLATKRSETYHNPLTNRYYNSKPPS